MKSLAVAQASLGPDPEAFPLFPPIVEGIADKCDTYQYPLEVTYDYSSVDRTLFKKVMAERGILRWQPLLPPLVEELSMGEGDTPLLDISRIASHSGSFVYLKDESRNPTFSHKDRLNLCTVSAAVLSGAKGIIAASTGNHGISTAAYAARAGIKCVILVPEQVSASYYAAVRAYGAYPVPLLASRRWEVLSSFVNELGFQPTSNMTPYHTGHPFGPEGYKTIAYELFEQLNRVPAALVVPTGYAELLFGLVKGFEELAELGITDRLPKAFSVEPAALGPLAKAHAEGLPMAMVEPKASALSSIACTVSGYRGIIALERSRGSALIITDEDARRAQTKYARSGLWLEVSSAAALAAAETIAPDFEDKDVVVIGTSSGARDPIAFRETGAACSTFEAALSYVADEYQVRLN